MPGLTRALEQSGYLPLLSTASRDELDVYDLTDLLQVDAWYEEPAARTVDVGTLGPILDSLQAQEPERPLGWFERFKRWLRSMLERRGGSSDNWLSRWLEEADVSDVVAKGILFVALALILGLTIFVIVNELRAAGIFRERPKQDDDGVEGGAAPDAGDAAMDLDALPVDRKASMLLRMLVATLVQSGRLRTERSLTHRELCARATFDDAQQRAILSARRRARGAHGLRQPRRAGRGSRADRGSSARARRTAARSNGVKDRLITLALAVGALAAFYAVLAPKPDTPQERMTRPLSTEAGPNGYLGLQRWLANEGVPVVSLRERYGALATIVPGVSTGNLLITTAPHVYPLRDSEVEPLQSWIEARQYAGRAGGLVRYAGMVDGRRPRCRNSSIT